MNPLNPLEEWMLIDARKRRIAKRRQLISDLFSTLVLFPGFVFAVTLLMSVAQ